MGAAGWGLRCWAQINRLKGEDNHYMRTDTHARTVHHYRPSSCHHLDGMLNQPRGRKMRAKDMPAGAGLQCDQEKPQEAMIRACARSL